MSGVRGDFSALAAMRAKLEGLADGSFQRELSQRLSESAETLIVDEFNAAKDPYGAEWKKSRRAEEEGGLTLSDTGRLKGSWSTQPLDNGFVVTAKEKYAAIHNFGGVIPAHSRRAHKLHFSKRGRFTSADKAASTQTVRMTRREILMPKRQIIPEGDLGPTWREAFEDEAKAALLEHMDGG